jgi:hypothetical protein
MFFGHWGNPGTQAVLIVAVGAKIFQPFNERGPDAIC